MTFDLSSLGWDEAFAADYARCAGPDREPARVTRVDPGVCTVLGVGGVLRASLGGCLLAAAAADPVRLPCPGDWIVVQHWPDERQTVERVLPRRTTIALAGSDNAVARLLAANIDTAAVVISATAAADTSDIEWVRAAARAARTRVIVILTIADRINGRADGSRSLRSFGDDVEVYAVRAPSGSDLERIRAHVAGGRTLALLGPPGSERARLIKALVGAEVLMSRAPINASADRVYGGGRVLIPVPGGGAIVDASGAPPGQGA